MGYQWLMKFIIFYVVIFIISFLIALKIYPVLEALMSSIIFVLVILFFHKVYDKW